MRYRLSAYSLARQSKAAKVDMRRTAVSPQGASRRSSGGRSPQKGAGRSKKGRRGVISRR
eukprot:scaffold8132_cov38-Phaeocystis_antarctica.AAC.3